MTWRGGTVPVFYDFGIRHNPSRLAGKECRPGGRGILGWQDGTVEKPKKNVLKLCHQFLAEVSNAHKKWVNRGVVCHE